MNAIVIGKKECGVCDAAKKKLELLKIPYDFVDIEEVLAGRKGWREDGSVDVLAYFSWNNRVIPTLVLDGKPYTYSAAMKFLKERK